LLPPPKCFAFSNKAWFGLGIVGADELPPPTPPTPARAPSPPSPAPPLLLRSTIPESTGAGPLGDRADGACGSINSTVGCAGRFPPLPTLFLVGPADTLSVSPTGNSANAAGVEPLLLVSTLTVSVAVLEPERTPVAVSPPVAVVAWVQVGATRGTLCEQVHARRYTCLI
jgi:hypothetical protein